MGRRALWILPLIFCILGTSSALAQTNTSSTAIFDVAHFSSKVSTLSKDSLGYPNKKAYDFLVCLREKSTGVRAVAAPFEITDASRSFYVVTDQNGCVTWREIYNFDFWAPETLINVSKKISPGLPSFLPAPIQFTLYVDPWSNFTFTKVGQAQGKAFSKLQYLGQNQWKVIPTINRQSVGYVKEIYLKILSFNIFSLSLNYELQAPVLLLKSNLANQPVSYKILDGKVDVDIFAFKYQGAPSIPSYIARLTMTGARGVEVIQPGFVGRRDQLRLPLDKALAINQGRARFLFEVRPQTPSQFMKVSLYEVIFERGMNQPLLARRITQPQEFKAMSDLIKEVRRTQFW